MRLLTAAIRSAADEVPDIAALPRFLRVLASSPPLGTASLALARVVVGALAPAVALRSMDANGIPSNRLQATSMIALVASRKKCGGEMGPPIGNYPPLRATILTTNPTHATKLVSDTPINSGCGATPGTLMLRASRRTTRLPLSHAGVCDF